MISNHLLVEPDQTRGLLAWLYRAVLLPALLDGKRLWLQVREETRTLPQNAKFHAICCDLAKSHVTWAGKRRSAKQWKVLLVSGHATATSEGSEIIPGLEGEFVNIRESTALMSVARGSSLIEYSIAFCAMHEVAMSDPEAWRSIGLMPPGRSA